ncbi:exopolysaccharide biosynthesis polyprenyl glycosylphosphotransferase [Nocardioides marinquilinus]|uniref:Exopolysaccharide biosynthesis polyprenyl glycosylphosphotransferase n=1 Tax=Nocardioides marinquilinus TaxID=1210400 RepID=A0ABP9P703_9ACTN
MAGVAVDLVAPSEPAPRLEPTTWRRPRPARRAGTRTEALSTVAVDVVVLVPLVLLLDVLTATAFVVGATTVLSTRGHYAERFHLSVLDDLPVLIAGVVVGGAAAVTLGLAWTDVGIGPLLLAIALTSVALPLGRALHVTTVRRRRRSGAVACPTLLVGGGPVARSLVSRVQAHPTTGIRLVGYVEESACVPGLPWHGSTSTLCSVVAGCDVRAILVGDALGAPDDLVDALRRCARPDLRIYLVPRLPELHRNDRADDQIWGVPLLRVSRAPGRRFSVRAKRAFDLVVAGAALLVLLPLLALLALAVRLDLGAPVIFRQERIGLRGRPFDVLKFRSMRPAQPGEDGAWTAGDRISTVGRLMRRYSLDELPQLVNVVRGEMSLVGPRPERPAYVDKFGAEVPWYRHRHRVPVGLTGLAAVEGLRGDTSIVDRAHFDNWYIENWSLWLDTKVLARTVLAVFRGSGG